MQYINLNKSIQDINNKESKHLSRYNDHVYKYLVDKYGDDTPALKYMMDYISKMNSVVDLICVGVLDGLRIPTIVMKYLISNDYIQPSRICLQEQSKTLLNKCEKQPFNNQYKNIQYVNTPVHELTVYGKPISYVFLASLNCAKFIEQALEIYKRNQDTVGKTVKISWLYLRNYSLQPTHDQLTIMLDDYSYDLTYIRLMRNNLNFIAYELTTENGFTSLLYSVNGAHKLFELVFDNSFVTVGDMHNEQLIVKVVNKNKIKDETSPTSGLIIAPDNYLGSQPRHLQTKVLHNIKAMFF